MVPNKSKFATSFGWDSTKAFKFLLFIHNLDKPLTVLIEMIDFRNVQISTWTFLKSAVCSFKGCIYISYNFIIASLTWICACIRKSVIHCITLDVNYNWKEFV